MSKFSNNKEIQKVKDSLESLTVEDKQKQSEKSLDESVEEYTEKELEYLDKYKSLSEFMMEDEEIYDIIVRHNFNDRKIKEEIDEILKLMKKKGDEYGWTKIEKGKSNYKFIFRD